MPTLTPAAPDIKRALDTGKLAIIRAAAAELPRVDLGDALQEDRRYGRRPNHPPHFKTPEGARQRSENSKQQYDCT
jgi:hypothetical protein